jgi:hypothetical protein
MKAIVLTYDKYIKFAEHMIHTYEKLWPSHPFIFRVPYGNYPKLFPKFRNRVEFLQMDCALTNYPNETDTETETDTGTKPVNPIRETVLTLLRDLPDEEWIFWCMDDKYIIRIWEEEANDIYDFVIKNNEPNLLVVNFMRRRSDGYFKTNKHIREGIKILTPNGQILRETSLETSLPDLWSHQFIRVKGLRRIFESFPDRPFKAKEMDSFKHFKEAGERQLIVENNLVVVGESTSRGEITENCAASFRRWRMKLPKDMIVSKKYMVYGTLPYRWIGFQFTLPPFLNRCLTDVTRWYWRNI